ncbi:MAG: UDP-glucose--hexose-1-phosphate uridylyltransferase [Eubacteriales bacterium]|nr:UDP-glucose--hexose-1-phosphate uridylyltransferase [Eubacteriales bacterium]
MDVQQAVTKLAAYALAAGLIEKEDIIYIANGLLKEMAMDSWNGTKEEVILCAEEMQSAEEGSIEDGSLLEELLNALTDDAVLRGLAGGESSVYRDLFDTRLMGVLTPRPSQIIRKFRSLYAENPKCATDWFYAFSCRTNDIRKSRVNRDLKWKTATEYGELDITINRSKPEKDPKAIAAAGRAKAAGYPKCALCPENEGYAGRLDHPARENHRIIPLLIGGEPWGFQYSPYVYYNEHCIVLNDRHVPMKIEGKTFERLFDFVQQFPHYFVGSNADLPIVGGSILSHDHFQGGRYTFAMEKASVEQALSFRDFPDVSAGILKWPMSVIRISGENTERLSELAGRILTAWRSYTDESAFVFAWTKGEPHSTVTPIARKREDLFELDLVLRNNITTEEHPLGVFHPHADLHHIKKENIGLIEVMGLAVLPARLEQEMEKLKDAVLSAKNSGVANEEILSVLRADPVLSKHADWAGELLKTHPEINSENIDEILKAGIGETFVRVLEDAGVFKRTPEGKRAFLRFIRAAGGEFVL